MDLLSRERYRRVRERFALPALLLSFACSEAAPHPGAGQGDDCDQCHSSPSAPVPFVTPRGVTDPTARGAGAHNAHLGEGTIRTALACEDCHPVPATPPGHYGSGVADVTFGALARTDHLQPSWNPAAATCSNTWCHGGGLDVPTVVSAAWTAAGSASCGSCHGAPPPPPHVQRTDCGTCHPDTVKPDGTIDKSLHVDGIVQVPGSCTACHGDSSREIAPPAPPSGTRGEKDTTTIAVGAHQSHLQAGTLRGPIDCGECHVVPTDLSHIDGTASVVFGTVARTDGPRTSWDPSTATCAGSYCHGATLGGGTNKTPQWTRVDGTQAACGTCHGLPPPAPHPPNANCNSCHPGTVNPDGSLNAGGGMHINGVVEVPNLSCTTCHGSSANPAPPLGTRGETATTTRAVGAHQSHVQPGPLSLALPCAECHVVPSSMTHANGVVGITFGTLATTGGATPQFNGTSCGGSYCHGSFRGGNGDNAPAWTRVDGTQASCGTCHRQIPITGRHALHLDEEIPCGRCHQGYGLTSVNVSLHVNGTKDVAPSTGWNPTRRSCANSCHGFEVWGP